MNSSNHIVFFPLLWEKEAKLGVDSGTERCKKKKSKSLLFCKSLVRVRGDLGFICFSTDIPGPQMNPELEL